MSLLRKTLNTNDKERIARKFNRVRNKYVKELTALRKKYGATLAELLIAYNEE